jgi:EpsI family protein
MDNYRVWMLVILLFLTGVFIRTHEETIVPVNKPLTELPYSLQNWTMLRETSFDERILKVLRPTDYLYRHYIGPDDQVLGLYIGYHGGGKDAGPIHSPKHCLPGSGFLHIFSQRRDVLIDDDQKINLVFSAYQSEHSKELFIYWYQIGLRTISNEYSLKIHEILNSLFNNRKESTFIRISIPFEHDPQKAEDIGMDFIRQIYPLLIEHIPV